MRFDRKSFWLVFLACVAIWCAMLAARGGQRPRRRAMTTEMWAKRAGVVHNRHSWEDAEIEPDGVGGKLGRPRVRMRRWGDRFALELIRPAGAPKVRVTDTSDDDKQFRLSANQRVRYRRLAKLDFPDGTSWRPEDGRLIQAIVWLRVPPPSNRWSFRIRAPPEEQLVFMPQGELTPADVAAGDVRPSYIIDSLAVYGTNPHRKLFHIPRAFATDAAGAWTWGRLRVVGNRVTKIIPAAWLAAPARVYPVRVDATMGYTSIGGTSHAILPNYLGLMIHVACPAGNVTSVSAYTSGTPRDITLGIYTEADALLADTGGGNSVNPGWTTQNLDASTAVVAETVYWLAIQHGTGSLTYYYDTAQIYRRLIKSNPAYSSGSLPSPPAARTSDNLDRRYSVYAIYTASGGAGAFVGTAKTGGKQ